MPAVFEWPTVPPRPPVASAFWRAARLHCPACGGGPVFLSWLRIGPACPSCGLNFTRGERGYWLGAYFVNLMAVEAIFAVMLGLALTPPPVATPTNIGQAARPPPATWARAPPPATMSSSWMLM